MENVLRDMLKKYCQVSSKHKTLKPVFPALEKNIYNGCSENCYKQSNVVKCPLAWFGCQQIIIFKQTSGGAVGMAMPVGWLLGLSAASVDLFKVWNRHLRSPEVKLSSHHQKVNFFYLMKYVVHSTVDWYNICIQTLMLQEDGS